MADKTKITPRTENFARWYQDVIAQAELAEPAERFALTIHMKRGAELWLTAGFAGERRAFDDRELFFAWLAHPLLTLKVIAAIHWEAVRLLLKGVPIYTHPARREKTAA